MLQHADSRLLSAYQFGAKSALAAVSLTQLLSSGNLKDSSTVQQLPQGNSLAQSPLNSEGSTSATPPFHLECSTPIPQDTSVWSEFLNGGSSNSFMGDNIDGNNTIPASTASTTSSSWWNSTRDQELQTQWNQSAAAQQTTTQPSQAPMAELEGGDWSPGQLGCLPTAPEVNEQQLSTMGLEQTDYSTMNTALVDPEISSAPSSWGSILMGGTGSEEQTLEAGTVEGLQEALFSKPFLGRAHHDLLSDVNMLKKPGESSWDFNPLKGAAAAFEMDEMSKQHFGVGSHDERMVSVDNWSIMNPRGGSNSYSFDAFGGGGGGSQFAPPAGKIKQEIDSHFFGTNVSSSNVVSAATSPQSLADSFKTVQMIPANDVQTRWGAQSSRLPAMLSQVLPSTTSAATKPVNLFGGNMQMSRTSFGNYSPSKGHGDSYKAQREPSSMSQHSSITSQHSYDSKDSRASKHMMEESREVTSDQKRSGEHHASETFFKRPRIESQQQQQPPTLPFKATTFVLQVRKEKLGERITALQQLVAPFGKTDTASVLLEAIGYIKFLHDQVQVLSTPYMKNPATTPARSNEGAVKGSSWSSEGNKSKDGDEPRQDLRSRGLCLVPISCTLQVANDNGADFWTPNIGGTGK